MTFAILCSINSMEKGWITELSTSWHKNKESTVMWIELLTCHTNGKVDFPLWGEGIQWQELTLVQQWPKCQCLRCGPVQAPPILHLLQSPVYMSLLNIGMDFLQNEGSCFNFLNNLVKWNTNRDYHYNFFFLSVYRHLCIGAWSSVIHCICK